MTPYQVMIEGVFVQMGADVGDGSYGFHTTFYVLANNAGNAVHRVREMITKRMQAHDVSETDSKLFKSYYCVHGIWEITEEKFKENSGIDSGFTFFRIGRFESIQLALRYLFDKRFRPWNLIAGP